MTTLLQDYFSAILAREEERSLSSGTAVSSAGGLELELVEDLAGLETLREDWNGLFEQAAASQQIFQSFEWNRVWAEHFLVSRKTCTRKTLAIATARRNGRLVALWPMAVRCSAGFKTLTWMGEPASQYGDALVEPGGVTSSDLRQSWDFLIAKTEPDVVSLRKVRRDAVAAPLLAEWGARATAIERAPFLDLASAPDFASYETRYSGKARKNRRRLMRRLAEKGVVSFTHVRHGEEARRLTLEAIAMKRVWLAHRNIVVSALHDDRLRAFFEQFVSRERAGTRALVSAISLDGRPLAIAVGLVHGGRWAGHILTYDVAHEGSGAGVLLVEEIIRRCFADGIVTLDFLAPADAYKLDWADASVETCDFTAAMSLAGRVWRSVYLEMLREPMKRQAATLPQSVRGLLRARLARYPLAPASKDVAAPAEGDPAPGT